MAKSSVQYRLRIRSDDVARALRLNDPEEVDAALQEIQVELSRYLGHLRLRSADGKEKLMDRRRRASLERRAGGERRRGRPIGSQNHAVLQLHLSLATIWQRHTGQPARRRYDAMNRYAEHGPYQDFVHLIISTLPRQLRPMRKGRVPVTVRSGIEEAKLARSAEGEFRRRGLIDEGLWT